MNQNDLLKLYKASRAGDVKAVAGLVSKLNPKLPADKKSLDRALQQVVYGRSVEATVLLLKAGANPNQDTISGTLVSVPACNGNLPLLQCLIAGGADYNRECKRQTALSAAMEAQEQPIIDYLEKLGAYSPPDTTLFYASKNGDMKRAEQAVARGANMEKTFDGETPLIAAVEHGQVELVKFLLKHGANPNKKLQGSCALFSAARYGKTPEILELLLAAGADLQSKENDETLLMAAAKANSLSIAKRLVELGLDVNARDKNFGATALDYARMNKHKELTAYLSGVGARGDRGAVRGLLTALAREFGGKVSEHSHGFELASKIGGNGCVFSTYLEEAKIVIRKPGYADAALKNLTNFKLVLGLEPDSTAAREVKAASKLLGLKVGRVKLKEGDPVLTEENVTDFCRRHQMLIKQLNLEKGEHVNISTDGASFFWRGLDAGNVVPRLKIFGDFIQKITREMEPERSLFENEWLIKAAPKKPATKKAASLGGTANPSVACPHCGHASNLMAQVDLSDPALPKTAAVSGKLPVFWCLTCLEWDPAFFDLSGSSPKPFANSDKSSTSAIPAGEADLPERPVTLVPVPPGKKAGRKSKLGGAPAWIQSADTPNCPKCEKPMAFALQLASDSGISYSDMGMLYAFLCPSCQTTASLIQSH